MQQSIDGLVLCDLRTIPTLGGPVLHMLRQDNPVAFPVGEVYFSEVLPHKVKAWKCHQRQTQRFAVPSGKLHIVIYDDRKNSPTCGHLAEYILGRPDAWRLLYIPPLLWYGFTAYGDHPALICNCPDLPHDPEESVRKDADSQDIPYCWASSRTTIL